MTEPTIDPAYFVKDEAELRTLYPSPRYLPVLDQLDRTCKLFIEHSPFVVIGARNPDIGIEVSPRGDAPGFVKVLDDHTLLIPDRAGNHRLDCMVGLLKADEIGLFFLVPGLTETLRIKGEVKLSREEALLDLFVEPNGKRPRLVFVVDVYEAFFHCGKAVRRSRLWTGEYLADAEAWQLSRGTLENSERSALDLRKMGVGE